jgi:hypothetical protein
MKHVLWIGVLSIGCGGSSASLADDQPAEGTRGGPCYPNNTCNAGLTCAANVCSESDAAAGETLAEDTGAASTDTGAPGDAAPADADAVPPGPYAPTTLSAACDMLGDGTNVAGANGDDESSAKLPLPFPFKYFGVSVTQYSMTSNGFAQLWDAPSGSPSKTPDNIVIPASSAPSGMVAPFWDDLVPQFSEARAGTLGSAPNRRFVMSWVHWTIKGQTSTRLTFQAKLFETTNVIEFHYCAMAPDGNARATGSSATIGLQNLAGTAGVQFSLNTAGAAPTGRALRFSP